MSGLAAHTIREFFLKPSMSQQNGTVLRSEERLEVGPASLWIMVAGFVTMIVLTFCVMYTTSQHLVARDPGLLSTDAIILASDPDIRKLLTPCGAMQTTEISVSLCNIKFSTFRAMTHSRSPARMTSQVKLPKSLNLKPNHGYHFQQRAGLYA